MFLQDKLSNKSPLFKLVLLIAIIIASLCVGTIFLYVLIMLLLGINFSEAIYFLNGLANAETINYLKIIQGFNGIILFIIPSVIFIYLFKYNVRWRYLPRVRIISLASLSIILVNPLTGYLYEINKKINFPDWVMHYEKQAELLTELFLAMNSFPDLLINLIVIGLIAAIGEEFFFRGILQQIIREWSGKIHFSILVTAFLFSAIHMQFTGFLPRFVLGILLGYLFYWTKNLWVPIISHFINNAVIVILSYKSIQEITSFDVLNHDIVFSWGEMCISTFIVIMLLYILYKMTCGKTIINQ